MLASPTNCWPSFVSAHPASISALAPTCNSEGSRETRAFVQAEWAVEERPIEVRERTQSRDHLAFVRTVLALERTVLAYVRTALAFAAVAVAVAHLVSEAWLAVWTIGALAGAMVAIAAYRSVRVTRSLRDAKAKLE